MSFVHKKTKNSYLKKLNFSLQPDEWLKNSKMQYGF